VLHVASTAAFQPGPSLAVYSATKAYVLSFGEAVAFELRHTPITMTVLCPGPTHTEFTDVAKTGNSALFDSPFASVMKPAEVARQGFTAMMAGKRVHITGFTNKMVAASGRFSPRAISLPVTNAILKP
jgi:short-subunit dehydrogenase